MEEEIDPDRVAKAAREGFGPELVPKGPARELASDYPLPDHVVESALARRVGTDGEPPPVDTAIRETGEALAEGVLAPGNEEVFKSDLGAKEDGRLIDHIEVEFDAGRETHFAELSRLGARAVIEGDTVRVHRRLLRDGVHAWITLRHDPGSGPVPFKVEDIDPLPLHGFCHLPPYVCHESRV